MNDAKHTPGPWECEEASECWHDDHVWAEGGREKGEHIANVCSGTANARLIAAAPDLLDALEVLLKKISHGVGDLNQHDTRIPMIEQAKAALDKAKGVVVIPYPGVTSHRKCTECGAEMRHHGYIESTDKVVCPVPVCKCLSVHPDYCPVHAA